MVSAAQDQRWAGRNRGFARSRYDQAVGEKKLQSERRDIGGLPLSHFLGRVGEWVGQRACGDTPGGDTAHNSRIIFQLDKGRVFFRMKTEFPNREAGRAI